MPYVGVKIPAPNLERLDRLARLRGVPRSATLRDAIALYLATVDPDPEEAARAS